jgi:uncharacterized protein YjbI with pentapeptide repeats
LRLISAAVGVLVVAILVSVVCGYLFGWTWTGVSGRTLWDWFQLLVVPAGLAGIAFLFNRWQSLRAQEQEDRRARTDRAIAAENQREEALQKYLDAMTELMLKENLRTSESEDEVRTVARTRTLALLRRLDPERKGLVLRFLSDSGLVDKAKSKIDLEGANLRDAFLYEARLSGTDLSGALVGDAFLAGADLSGADLSCALGGDANLARADLTGANLTGAYLVVANLAFANLNGADLSGADLTGADLFGALADAQTIWPDGFDFAAAQVKVAE